MHAWTSAEPKPCTFGLFNCSWLHVNEIYARGMLDSVSVCACVQGRGDGGHSEDFINMQILCKNLPFAYELSLCKSETFCVDGETIPKDETCIFTLCDINVIIMIIIMALWLLHRWICGQANVSWCHPAHACVMWGTMPEGLCAQPLDIMVALLTHLLWKKHWGQTDEITLHIGLQRRRWWVHFELFCYLLAFFFLFA